MTKGQVSFEFMVFIGIMFALLGLASYAAIVSSSGIESENEVAEARKISYLLASEINIAAETGPGYSRTFYLQPLFYNGLNYSVNLSEAGFVTVFWENKMYSLPMLARNVTGAVKKGTNTIKNENDVIAFD